MLLRASSAQEGHNADLQSVTDTSLSPGVPQGDCLAELTETTINGDWLHMAQIRGRAEATMGPQQVVDALTVAAAFNGITRVADATGIPLDDNTAAVTQDMRLQTGIENFAYASKSARYDKLN